MIRLIFYGFSPALPVPLIIVLLLLCVAAAWWSYSRVSEEKRDYRVTLLLSLRTATFLLLSLLLLNPYLLTTESNERDSHIAIYLDSSKSMTIERGNYQGENEYLELIDKLVTVPDGRFSSTIFSFDETVRDTFPTLTGTGTNINLVMEHIRENAMESAAAILVTDGIPTVGRNPLFTAQLLPIPVVVFAVGDTSEVRDIAVSDVSYNPLTFVNTRQTISVEILHEGFSGSSATINLLKNGDLLKTSLLDFSSDRGSILKNFIVEFNETGFYEFTVEVPAFEEELTDQNNTVSFIIEVVDDKTVIHSLAFEIHPDVSAIRRIISSDMQNELIVTNYFSDDRVTGADPFSETEEADLLVLHGVPDPDSAISEWIQRRDGPALLFLLPRTFRNQERSAITDTFGYSVGSFREGALFEMDMGTMQDSHALLDNLTIPLRLPRLSSTLADYTLSPLSNPLVALKSDGEQSGKPLLILNESTLHRRAVITPFGWYRVNQHSDPQVRALFTQLITNLISWSATASDSRNLILNPTRNSFTESESVTIRASLFNERGEPEPDALIRLQLFSGDDTDTFQEFVMHHLQNEIYEATPGIYPGGIYRITAEATKNDRVIGRAESRFYVTNSTVEFVNTRRNDILLSQIAEVTRGVLITDGTVEKISEFLDGITESAVTDITQRHDYLHRSFIWFLVVLLLLTAEWILRKQLSLQ